jgi:hypothetical protein
MGWKFRRKVTPFFSYERDLRCPKESDPFSYERDPRCPKESDPLDMKAEPSKECRL